MEAFTEPTSRKRKRRPSTTSHAVPPDPSVPDHLAGRHLPVYLPDNHELRTDPVTSTSTLPATSEGNQPKKRGRPKGSKNKKPLASKDQEQEHGSKRRVSARSREHIRPASPELEIREEDDSEKQLGESEEDSDDEVLRSLLPGLKKPAAVPPANGDDTGKLGEPRLGQIFSNVQDFEKHAREWFKSKRHRAYLLQGQEDGTSRVYCRNGKQKTYNPPGLGCPAECSAARAPGEQAWTVVHVNPTHNQACNEHEGLSIGKQYNRGETASEVQSVKYWAEMTKRGCSDCQWCSD